jgi:ABC-type uncharacterized transport system substrate-binding protein
MLYRVVARLLIPAMTVGIAPSPADAHPHAWIDVRTTVILSEHATVSAIREEWRFDKLYTNYLLKDDKGQWKPLEEFTVTSMHHLKPYGYFMEMHANGARLTLGETSQAQSQLSGDSLVMHFTVSVATPVDISKAQMTFSVYDPTYYIAFAHVKDHPIAFEGPDATACSAHIKQATPSIEVLRQAQAMDRNATVNNSLGKMFAETVAIHCRLPLPGEQADSRGTRH